MEIQRERDSEGRSIYAKQQRARRAKPSDGVEKEEEEEETLQQSKTETVARVVGTDFKAQKRKIASGEQIPLRDSTAYAH